MSSTATTIDPATFEFFFKLIRDKSAIVLDLHKSYLIESRLSPLVRQHGLNGLGDLVKQLRKPNASVLTQEVVEAMTTNETSFFRDLHPFEALRSRVLPDLIQARKHDRKLTIWSNACSSGQEPYTIAMLICEHFPELMDWDLEIIATDLSQKIIDRAKSGVFSQTEVNRGLPTQMLLKYFTRTGMQWALKDQIRNMVRFKSLNLVDHWHLNPVADIVFLRNVLIYFDVDAKVRILNRIRQQIHQNGYLFLGGAETTMNLDVRFERESIGRAACYRPT